VMRAALHSRLQCLSARGPALPTAAAAAAAAAAPAAAAAGAAGAASCKFCAQDQELGSEGRAEEAVLVVGDQDGACKELEFSPARAPCP